MAIREIRQYGDDALLKTCRPVERVTSRVLILLDDMAETMYKHEGVGLAAPQVGILRRIVVLDDGAGLLEMINPRILTSSGESDDREGCLSMPNVMGMVVRPQRVVCRAMNRNGDFFDVEAEGLLARAICHELDHLDGVLYTQKAYRMLSQEEMNA